MNEEDYIIGYGGGGKGGGGGGGQEDQNTLFSTAKGRVVDLLSEGEIVGLLNGKKSIHLDGTPVQPASGADNFEGISWASRYGTNTQDYIPGFAGTETTTSVNTIVNNGSPGAVIRTFTSSIVDAVRVGLWVPALTASTILEVKVLITAPGDPLFTIVFTLVVVSVPANPGI
jgi:predicted phage tail protein